MVLLQCDCPVPIDPTLSTNTTNAATSTSATNSIRLIRLGSQLSASVTLDHNQRAVLRGVEVSILQNFLYFVGLP